jgi:hypothetical protein
MQRPAGVSIPQGQNQVADAQQTRGAPRQLLSIAKLETYGIQYTDDTGAVHVALCHKMGDVVYIHPNDEQWASSIRTATAWLTKDVNDRIAAHEAVKEAEAAPDKPMVDIEPPKEG